MVDRTHQFFPRLQKVGNISFAIITTVDSEGSMTVAHLELSWREIFQRLADHVYRFDNHAVGIFIDQFDLHRIDRIVIVQIVAEPGTTMIMGKRKHDLMTFQLEFLFDLCENTVAHTAGHTLKITGDQYRAVALVVFQGQCFHPDIMQLSIGKSFGSITGQPDPCLRCDDDFGDPCFPLCFGVGFSISD